MPNPFSVEAFTKVLYIEYKASLDLILGVTRRGRVGNCEHDLNKLRNIFFYDL